MTQNLGLLNFVYFCRIGKVKSGEEGEQSPMPSWGGTSPIHHPRGPPQIPKATKNTTEISRSHLAAVFIGKEGNNHLKSVTC